MWKDLFFNQYLVLRKISSEVVDAFIHAGYNFKIQHFVIFLFVINKPGVTQGDIMRYCVKSKSTIRRAIDQLVEQKMIRKRAEQKANGKGVLEITAKGEKTFQELNNIYKTVSNKMLLCISKEERDTTSKLLEKIMTKIGR